MASSFDKSVKGATKQKLAAPKSKYVEHILIATHSGDAGVAEVFRALQNRLRDSTWTIVFKALIVVHLMMREGEPDVTLRYLSHAPGRRLAINQFVEAQAHGRSIRAYSEYLLQRAVSYSQTKVDYVRGGEGRLKRLTVDKGLLRESETVQDQISALLKCDFLSHEPENEITLTAFRMLTMDLLVLFHVMNEATINVLEHYLEMSATDAQRALKIYRTFTKQTDKVVQYLSIARHYEHATRLEIPTIKHAPTGLAAQLEEYLKDPDFDINRRQYLVQAEAARKSGKSTGTSSSKPFGQSKSATKQNTGSSFPAKEIQPAASTTTAPKAEAKPAPDLIDFFESIEPAQPAQSTAPMFSQHSQQQQGFPVQLQQQDFSLQQQHFDPQQTGMPGQSFSPQTAPPTNPFSQLPQQQMQMQTGFGAPPGSNFYPPQQQPQSFQPMQSIPQNNVPPFQQQQQPAPLQQVDHTGAQNTNPFRQSMLPQPVPTSNTSSPGPFAQHQQQSQFSNTPGLNRQSTNPFAKSSSPFTSPPPQQQPPPPQSQGLQPLQAAPTGTNPFARQPSPGNAQPFAQTNSALTANATGSTNPFRQSAFVNQQTGQGWQNGPQNSMGGIEHLDSVPVFPRPGQQPVGQQGPFGGQPQQQQQQQPWQ